jgi:hypothetical protein
MKVLAAVEFEQINLWTRSLYERGTDIVWHSAVPDPTILGSKVQLYLNR